MKRRRKKRSLMRDVTGFTRAGVGIGIGTVIVSRAGGTSVLPAFSTLGSMMRPVGMAMMGGYAMRGLHMIGSSYKKKRRQ